MFCIRSVSRRINSQTSDNKRSIHINMEDIVTICIPTFNRVNYLRSAIEKSILQTYKHIVILISDNNSSDDTQRFCEDCCSKDSRIIYHRQKKNIGALNNFFFLLDECKSDFFMWHSDDDYMDLDYVEKCMTFHKSNQGYSLVSGTPKYIKNGSFLKYGSRIDILKDNANDRIYEFYRKTRDNGIFYGIQRRKCSSISHWQNCWAGDQIFIANLAYAGKIKTLADVYFYRSDDGTSSSLKQVIDNLKLPRIQYYFPYYTLAYEIFVNSISIKRSQDRNASIGNFIFAILCAKSYLNGRIFRSIKYLLALLFRR